MMVIREFVRNVKLRKWAVNSIIFGIIVYGVFFIIVTNDNKSESKRSLMSSNLIQIIKENNEISELLRSKQDKLLERDISLNNEDKSVTSIYDENFLVVKRLRKRSDDDDNDDKLTTDSPTEISGIQNSESSSIIDDVDDSTDIGPIDSSDSSIRAIQSELENATEKDWVTSSAPSLTHEEPSGIFRSESLASTTENLQTDSTVILDITEALQTTETIISSDPSTQTGSYLESSASHETPVTDTSTLAVDIEGCDETHFSQNYTVSVDESENFPCNSQILQTINDNNTDEANAPGDYGKNAGNLEETLQQTIEDDNRETNQNSSYHSEGDSGNSHSTNIADTTEINTQNSYPSINYHDNSREKGENFDKDTGIFEENSPSKSQQFPEFSANKSSKRSQNSLKEATNDTEDAYKVPFTSIVIKVYKDSEKNIIIAVDKGENGTDANKDDDYEDDDYDDKDETDMKFKQKISEPHEDKIRHNIFHRPVDPYDTAVFSSVLPTVLRYNNKHDHVNRKDSTFRYPSAPINHQHHPRKDASGEKFHDSDFIELVMNIDDAAPIQVEPKCPLPYVSFVSDDVGITDILKKISKFQFHRRYFGNYQPSSEFSVQKKLPQFAIIYLIRRLTLSTESGDPSFIICRLPPKPYDRTPVYDVYRPQDLNPPFLVRPDASFQPKEDKWTPPIFHKYTPSSHTLTPLGQNFGHDVIKSSDRKPTHNPVNYDRTPIFDGTPNEAIDHGILTVPFNHRQDDERKPPFHPPIFDKHTPSSHTLTPLGQNFGHDVIESSDRKPKDRPVNYDRTPIFDGTPNEAIDHGILTDPFNHRQDDERTPPFHPPIFDKHTPSAHILTPLGQNFGHDVIESSDRRPKNRPVNYDRTPIFDGTPNEAIDHGILTDPFNHGQDDERTPPFHPPIFDKHTPSSHTLTSFGQNFGHDVIESSHRRPKNRPVNYDRTPIFDGTPNEAIDHGILTDPFNHGQDDERTPPFHPPIFDKHTPSSHILTTLGQNFGHDVIESSDRRPKNRPVNYDRTPIFDETPNEAIDHGILTVPFNHGQDDERTPPFHPPIFDKLTLNSHALTPLGQNVGHDVIESSDRKPKNRPINYDRTPIFDGTPNEAIDHGILTVPFNHRQDDERTSTIELVDVESSTRDAPIFSDEHFGHDFIKEPKQESEVLVVSDSQFSDQLVVRPHRRKPGQMRRRNRNRQYQRRRHRNFPNPRS